MPFTDSIDTVQPAAAVTGAELRCLLVILKQYEQYSFAATNRIAADLQVKPPSVCKLLNHLLDKQLIHKEPYGKIVLTETGSQAARFMKDRVSALQASVAAQLHLNESASLQTALFLACHMDEENQRKVLCCGHADNAEPGNSADAQTRIGQEAVI